MPTLFSRKTRQHKSAHALPRPVHDAVPVLPNIWTDVAIALSQPDALRTPVARLIRAAIAARPDLIEPSDLRPHYIDAAIAACLSGARESGQPELKAAADRLDRARNKVSI